MQFDVLTLFPGLIDNYMSSSMMRKARVEKIIRYKAHDIRNYAVDDYGHVDDTLYGGGRGMLIRPEPIYAAHQVAVGEAKADTDKSNTSRSLTIFLSPKGEVFNQDMAKEFAQLDQLILICGHYEGIDQRIIDEVVDREVSLGDYVLTGGELGALAIIDATSRMLPNFLADEDAMEHESHYYGTLESRQYTKPREWAGQEVPEVLLSGNHQAIDRFKYLDGLNETLEKRPDMFEKLNLSAEDLEDLLEYRKNL